LPVYLKGGILPAVATAYVQMLRLISRDMRLFLVTAVLSGLAWDGIRTVLFNLYLLRLGYGLEFVGLVNSVGMLAFAFSALPAWVYGGAAATWSSLAW
jgi:hypothetical protein